MERTALIHFVQSIGVVAQSRSKTIAVLGQRWLGQGVETVLLGMDQATRCMLLSSVGTSSVDGATHPGEMPNASCFTFLCHSHAVRVLSSLCASQVIARSAEHGLHLSDSLLLSILQLLDSVHDEVQVDTYGTLALLTHTLPKHLIQATDGRAPIAGRIVQRRGQAIRWMLSGLLDHTLQAVHSLVPVGSSLAHPLVLVLGLTMRSDVQNSLLLGVTIGSRIILISAAGIVLSARTWPGKTCELHLATV